MATTAEQLKTEQLKYYKTWNDDILPKIQTIVDAVYSVATTSNGLFNEISTENIKDFMSNIENISKSPETIEKFYSSVLKKAGM